MWGTLIKWALKTVLGRYVTVILVTLLLGGGAWKWYSFKEDLRTEGAEECIQIVNEETHRQLIDALAAEKSAVAKLRARAVADAVVNSEARTRHRELETQVSDLEKAMAEQARTDNEYKEWGDTPLPTGVAERMREQAADNPDPNNEDSN